MIKHSIGIIGLDGVGKTSYIVAMAHALLEGMRLGDELFFSALSDNYLQMIYFNKSWYNICSGQWPGGTVEGHTFDFSCFVNFRTNFEFDIYDYRGGALYGGIDKDDVSERMNLIEMFSRADTLLCFIDTNDVLKAIEGDLDAYDKIEILQLYISEVIKNSEEKVMPPTMFVLTKSDVANNSLLEECKKFVKYTFESLFSLETDLEVGIAAVSLGNCQPMADSKGYLMVRPKTNNILVPIFFSLYHGLSGILNKTNLYEILIGNVKEDDIRIYKDLLERLKPLLFNNAEIYKHGIKQQQKYDRCPK